MASAPSSSPPSDSTPPPPPPTSSSPPPPSSSSPPPPPVSSSSPPLPPVSSSSPPPPPDSSSPPPPPAKSPPVFSPPPPPPSGDRRRSPPAQDVITPSPPRPEPSSSSNNNSSSRSPSTHKQSVSTTDAAIIGGGALILALMVICLIYLRRKEKRQYYLEQGPPPKSNPVVDSALKIPPPPGFGGPPLGENSPNSGSNPAAYMHQPISPNVGGYGSKSPFTYDELAAATSKFSQANLLGQGGFGYVYKGVLPNGKEVAVKSLKYGSGQGEREFQAEVEIISRVHHRYLVSLVGYCIAGEQRMLVYEFVANNTLEFHLHAKGGPVMDWASRLRIAVGSAKGLAYLHEDCHPRIIHRDIKSANILLDSNYEAKVADFGLAKLSSDNFTHVSTRVMGTFGYLAPEYAASGKLTEKSDVFSFGVMLLEIITGRRPVDPTNKSMDSLSLVDWARPLAAKALESGDYSGMVDRRLEDKYVPQELARMIASAAACIRHSSRSRPRMSQIVRALEGDASLDDLNEGMKATRAAGQSQQVISQPFNNPNGGSVLTYDTGAYNADMMKFRKMVMTSTQEFNSNEYGTTSEYGLNHSSSSSSDSTEMESPRKQNQ